MILVLFVSNSKMAWYDSTNVMNQKLYGDMENLDIKSSTQFIMVLNDKKNVALDLSSEGPSQ